MLVSGLYCVYLQSFKDAGKACNLCNELILVPGGAVWLRPRGGKNQGGVHRGDHSQPNVQEPVSCLGALS